VNNNKTKRKVKIIMKNTLITAITGLTMISGLNAQYLTGTSSNYGGKIIQLNKENTHV
jgi:hypothetical protein